MEPLFENRMDFTKEVMASAYKQYFRRKQKVLNVILLGTAVREGLLPFSREQLLTTLEAHVPKKFTELNRRAFEVGYDYEKAGGNL